MQLKATWKGLPRSARLAIIALLCVAIYAGVGFLVVPRIVQSQLVSRGSEALDRPVTLGEARFNPFALSLTLRDLEVAGRSGAPLARFDEFYVNLQLSSIVRRAFTFAEIRLVEPGVHLAIQEDGELDIADLLAPDEDPEPAPDAAEDEEPGSGMPSLRIDRLAIERGRFDFEDRSNATPFAASLTPIDVSLDDFRTSADGNNRYAFDASLGGGGNLHWEGTIQVEPLHLAGELKLAEINTRKLWEYAQDRLDFELVAGRLAVGGRYDLAQQDEELRLDVSEGFVTLDGLQIEPKRSDEVWVAIPELAVRGIALALHDQRVDIERIESRGARFSGWREPDGEIGFAKLGDNGADPPPSSAPPKEPATEGPKWSVQLAELELDDWAFAFEDRVPPSPVELGVGPLHLRLANLSLEPGARFDVELATALGGGGRFSADGSASLDPPAADLDLELAELALATFAPYVASAVQLDLRDGSARLAGKLQYGGSEADAPLVRYRGSLGVDELATFDTVIDKRFVSWQALDLAGVELDVEPTRVRVETVSAAQPYARVIVGADGRTNLQEVLTPPTSQPGDASSGEAAEEQEPAPEVAQGEEAAPSVPVHIGEVKLSGGSATYRDESLWMIFDAGIVDLGGSVVGIATDGSERTQIDLEGALGDHAPVIIKGGLDPMAPDQDVDLTLSFKNADLTMVTPYSGKFAGYEIEKGKLSIDVAYKVENQRLVGKSTTFIDQLTLGERVDSPDAADLPLSLALALLKDKNGEIHLDVPFEGDLADPSFGVSGLILGIIWNVVEKAAAAPFSLIGGLVGASSESLDRIDFEAGSGALSEQQSEKLALIAKALDERPELVLEIRGTTARERDRRALAEAALLDRQRAIYAGRDEDLTQVVLSEKQSRKSLEKLYEERFGEDPRDAYERRPASDVAAQPEAGGPAELGDSAEPAARAESAESADRDGDPEAILQAARERLIGSISIDDGALQDLADRRAGVVRDQLVEQNGLPAERIFLLNADLDVKTDADVPTQLVLNAH